MPVDSNTRSDSVGWMPIESAPKDGTEIIVLSGAKGVSLGWFFIASSRTQGWLDQRGRQISPTHWMPFPKIPAPENFL